MSLKVICSQCGGQMILQFVKVGEQFACRQCGSHGVVPAEAESSELPATVIPEPASATELNSPPDLVQAAVRSEPRPLAPAGIRVFSIVASTANALYLFFMILGVLSSEKVYDGASKVVFLILLAVGVTNIFVLSGTAPFLRKALIAFNLVFFSALPLLWLFVHDDPQVKIGSVMLLLVGIVSAIALTVCHRESWLFLRLERSRLEEMKRVADLKKELELIQRQTEN